MSKRIFSKEEIETLLQNENVINCSERSITYSKDFKIQAIGRYHEGLPPSEIFRQAGLDVNTIGRKSPKDCLRRWLKIFREKGQTGIEADGRGQNNKGGRPRGMAGMTDKEKLKRLEAEVAYLKEENRFLARLRKKS